jgi:hypothetical protein
MLHSERNENIEAAMMDDQECRLHLRCGCCWSDSFRELRLPPSAISSRSLDRALLDYVRAIDFLCTTCGHDGAVVAGLFTDRKTDAERRVA